MNKLAKNLGLPMLVFYGIGMTLGAGIYSIIGKAAGHTGDTLWWSFLFAGVAAALTALSYAEVSAMYPKAGAEYVYLENTFPKKHWLASIAGYSMAFAGATTASTVALAFAGYLSAFVPVSQVFAALILVAVVGALAVYGVRESGWVNLVFTLIEISGLFIVIYLGFQSGKITESLSSVPDAGTFRGAALIIFAFFGFENIVNLASEAKNPERDLPRAIFICLVVALTLYIGVSLSALALLPAQRLAESDSALMTAVQSAGKNWGSVLGVIALFSTANTALISLIGASRVLYGMSDGKALPKSFAKVLPKRKTPWLVSLIAIAVCVAFLPLKGGLETVASVSSFATMAAFFLVNLSVIVLRFREPKKKRPFRIPGAVGNVPLAPVLGGLATSFLMIQFF